MAALGEWEGATPLQLLGAIDPSLDWDDLAELRELAPLPLVLKGIQTAEDAVLAVEHGADAIVVSNHGGRQLDAVGATAVLLPEIVEAVAGRIEVYVDGGIRRGSDVVKALALGARAVLVGRAPLWGLACDGEAGARRVLELLHGEIELALALCGCASPDAVSRQRTSIESSARDRDPHPQRRRRPARRRAGGEAEAGPAAAGQARHRRHLARPPCRPRHPAAADARLPGRRPRRRLHRRRLHDADRRPVRPLRRAADPLARGDRRERQDLRRAGVHDRRSARRRRCASTANGSPGSTSPT